jgi:ferredoxin/flavodoxin
MNAIFYFTGTGNSLKVARGIAAGLGDTKLASVCAHFGEDLSGCERIGFVYPVYFGGVPLMVKKFVESIEAPANAYLFAIATRGGFAGNGLSEMNALLSQKGRGLDFGTLLMMGANYILLYGRLFNANFANRRAEKALPALAAAIKGKEKRPCGLPKPGTASRLEQARGNVHEAALEYTVSGNCTSCGLCSKICPAENIGMKGGKPVFGSHCEQCMACLQWCPQEAINYRGKTESRKRYRHPGITAADMINSGRSAEGKTYQQS